VPGKGVGGVGWGPRAEMGRLCFMGIMTVSVRSRGDGCRVADICRTEYDEKSRDIFGANYPRLQKLKAKYDPSNLFNKLFPIAPQA
jgi:Berberine and berberine like